MRGLILKDVVGLNDGLKHVAQVNIDGMDETGGPLGRTYRLDGLNNVRLGLREGDSEMRVKAAASGCINFGPDRAADELTNGDVILCRRSRNLIPKA